jgi:hypothetical protein
MSDDDDDLFDDLFSALDKDVFGGETYEAERDFVRLKGQLKRTWDVMKDGKWRTLKQIANEASALRADRGRDSEAAISARLRDFRKKEFGKYEVHARNDGGGLWRYRLWLKEPGAQTPEPAPISSNAYYDKEGRLIKEQCAVEGCTNSPAFSVGFFPRQGLLGMWYCLEHWKERNVTEKV